MSTSTKPTNGSKILSKVALPGNEAKWIKLTKINWQDPSGKQRIWESAERSTRNKGGIDGNFTPYSIHFFVCKAEVKIFSGWDYCGFEGGRRTDDCFGQTISSSL